MTMTQSQGRQRPGMLVQWVSHLKDQQDRDKFERSVANWLNDPITQRYLVLIEQIEQKLNRTESGSEQYDNPSWAHKQAHTNGMKHAFRLIKELTNT